MKCNYSNKKKLQQKEQKQQNKDLSHIINELLLKHKKIFVDQNIIIANEIKCPEKLDLALSEVATGHLVLSTIVWQSNESREIIKQSQ